MGLYSSFLVSWKYQRKAGCFYDDSECGLEKRTDSNFGKNYTRRFKDTDLFEQIFSQILQECYTFKRIDPSEVFVDATHMKARANKKKMKKRIAHEEALFFEDFLTQCTETPREIANI